MRMDEARVRVWLASLGVGVATAALMLATGPRLAITWDEGDTLGMEARIRDWFRAMRNPQRFAAEWRAPHQSEELITADGLPPPRREQLDTRTELLFDRHVVAWFWPCARELPHCHPPFYALLGLAGDLLAPSWDTLPRARLGPILLFSFTAGVIFGFVAGRWGCWAAALATSAWVFQPNLFAHGHYACMDATLTALWALAIVTFAQAMEPAVPPREPGSIRWGWTLGFGLAVGCALASKLTGWFLPIPFLVWAGLYRSRRASRTLLVGLLVASAVAYALVPPWWTDPIDGVSRFVASGLSRSATFPLRIQFLHAVYETPRESLPWYNTLVWTVLVTPVGFLAMAGVGFWSALRGWRREPIGLLVAGNWAFLMAMRAMPHTPGHDGVRLFLPAFGVLALLGGMGAWFLIDRWSRLARAAIVACVLEGALSVAVMMPVPLSYFSPIVGGLPGAAALGMEPTYYWDALGPGPRRWLAQHSSPGETIQFAMFTRSFLYLRRVGELPPRLASIDPGRPRWVVLQNRPGAFSDIGRALVARGHPQYTLTKLGIPLIWIFPYREMEELAAELRR
jgi:4-amino-4-deoxy-L-arabinose transferase-like glycosyltransferase